MTPENLSFSGTVTGQIQHFPLDLLRKMTSVIASKYPHSSAHGLLRARFASASQTIRSGPRHQKQHDGVHQHHRAPTQHLHLKLGTETAPNLRTWHAPQRACITIFQNPIGICKIWRWTFFWDCLKCIRTFGETNTVGMMPKIQIRCVCLLHQIYVISAV